MTKLNQILKKHWGFDELRPLQQQAVDSILEKKNTVVLLPTGGGKSICYQLPAAASEGLALVVSPLISLMQDQVTQLNKRSIKAMHLSGELRQREVDQLLSNAAYGGYKLLYISPERLQSEWILERFRQMNLSLIAVDEAHCISQWGFDFRPSYLNIKNLIDLVPEVPVMALTATATKQVLADIKSQLKFENPFEVRDTFFRTNLGVNMLLTERKEARCLSLLQQTKGSTIIYVRNRKATAALAKYLNSQKISAHFYHAGMDAAERLKNQKDWMLGRVRVMVATTAFGMGIDKADVRFIVHLDIPDSPESYYQEIGRAGRDGKSAFCFLFYNKADVLKLESSWKDEPKIDEIRKIYTAFLSEHQIAIGGGKYSERPLKIYPFCAKYKFSSRHVHQAFTLLDRMSFLIYQDVSSRPSSLRFLMKGDDLYRFQIQNPSLETVTKSLLRLYGGIVENRSNISEELVSRKTGMPVKQVIKHIEILAKRKIVSYKKRYNGTTITLLTERLPDSHLRVSPELLKLRLANKETRANAMLQILANDQVCRMQQLVAYFDEQSEKSCGQCDVCKKTDPHYLEARILRAIEKEEISLQQLIVKYPGVASEQLKAAVERLLDNGNALLSKNGKLQNTKN